MTRTATGWQPTPRDNDILSALELLPLTPEQLLKWSERFAQPFPQIDDVRRRLRKLHTAGLVRRWPLLVECRGSLPYYYKLSPDGFDFLRQRTGLRPARRRSFSPVGIALHSHTKALSDFIVHAGVAAHRIGAALADLYPENVYQVDSGDEHLKLDWRFSLLHGPLRRTYNVELDNSTETIFSARDGDSIGRKIRLLDDEDAQYNATDSRRAVTLFVTTRSRERLSHILDAAATLLRNPDRSVVYGVHLADFLSTDQPLVSTCFSDHRARRVALLSAEAIQNTSATIPQLAVPVGVC